jgi:hypothetical protein
MEDLAEDELRGYEEGQKDSEDFEKRLRRMGGIIEIWEHSACSWKEAGHVYDQGVRHPYYCR